MTFLRTILCFLGYHPPTRETERGLMLGAYRCGHCGRVYRERL